MKRSRATKVPLRRILFLQLPCLDNESGRKMENLPMAGFYLLHSLRRCGEAERLDIRFLSREEELLDDRHILQKLLTWRPDVICSTLYLWNIERTLHILRRLKSAYPPVRIVVGGPEVSVHHPFLFRSLLADVAVIGEGEGVFPGIFRALQMGTTTDYANVAWRAGRGYMWGRKTLPLLSLEQCLPPAEDSGWTPDINGIAYMETGRGCPMSCTYCWYAHLRRRMSFLSLQEVETRIRTLCSRGAREIRFVDPSFNAHPLFPTLLHAIARLNKPSRLRFFAEIRAETLSTEEIALMADAGFSELEVGVQSRDPEVLRRIRRPGDLRRIEQNLMKMVSRGIEVTLDLMFGLPGQTLEEVAGSLQWARSLGVKNVQCLQTLLIPGTELREQRRRWRMRADPLPPYGVRSTPSLNWEEMRTIEQRIQEESPSDCMTSRFVGFRLPDLFEEKVVVNLEEEPPSLSISGASSRRAILLRGDSLFSRWSAVQEVLREALGSEPHMLWQFVLNPGQEFPLDLLENMIAEVRSVPSHWIDRFASVASWNRIASRRVFVLLRPGSRYSRPWREAAEQLLEEHFF